MNTAVEFKKNRNPERLKGRNEGTEKGEGGAT